MGLEDNGVIRSSSIWKKARIGENTIIGNLDTDMRSQNKPTLVNNLLRPAINNQQILFEPISLSIEKLNLVIKEHVKEKDEEKESSMELLRGGWLKKIRWIKMLCLIGCHKLKLC
ncbi:uncharacterized protein LOC110884748 isoform X1 [Helianthus annuus]|uniref:uncharacterized protein LOC110884748 isoform X1 n=1 Tax=Helianthus annuus TaxID=4232 RepID=UPI000B8F34BA|nr:uncharacterized protein LOC110884748 isoform X1 [Helianthus annuus]XP_021988151.1 uncharacterized protein LOC110884748 isoform X1 [Helianthus annuus]XP_021988152.1 uncharacterized protein LOC110884748 isoform X1 [Helianthus annuus]KAJ0530104.1 hypothetical protein HanHA89_Chr10g0385791 [Helianthus annuus]